LVAEEVAAVNPDLVVRDKNGEIYSVRYDAVNTMLLNEFLKEHRQSRQQQKEIDALKAELKEQRALIQAVNDKVECINLRRSQTFCGHNAKRVLSLLEVETETLTLHDSQTAAQICFHFIVHGLDQRPLLF